MNSGTEKENVIILNPRWSLDSERWLVVQPSIESFQAAMRYVTDFREKIGTIMMLVDVPPRIQHATQIFKTRSDARNKSRRLFGMRHLWQFAPWIQEYYLDHLPSSVTTEDIRILTETMVREIVVNLPADQRDKLPKCRNTESCSLPDWKQSAGCLEITITSLRFALNPAKGWDIFWNDKQEHKLHIFAQPSSNLPGEYIAEAPHHLPEWSWKRTIIK